MASVSPGIKENMPTGQLGLPAGKRGSLGGKGSRFTGKGVTLMDTHRDSDPMNLGGGLGFGGIC